MNVHIYRVSESESGCQIDVLRQLLPIDYTFQARGDEARKAQGDGKRNLHLVLGGRWTIARGPSHTPFGGVRNLANTYHVTYRRCGANWAPPSPYNSYSHCSETHPGEGRTRREADEWRPRGVASRRSRHEGIRRKRTQARCDGVEPLCGVGVRHSRRAHVPKKVV
eukprot:scaffold12402_cov134-Isochrysis_galbana.AAC.4